MVICELAAEILLATALWHSFEGIVFQAGHFKFIFETLQYCTILSILLQNCWILQKIHLVFQKAIRNPQIHKGINLRKTPERYLVDQRG